MQTFLPLPSYVDSAKVLDYRRLGKQRVETKQILLAMSKGKGGWVNHPATKMWRGYEMELCVYGLAMCREWVRRGYKDSLIPFFEGTLAQYELDGRRQEAPPWLGEDEFHASHRSNLLRKDPTFYGKYGWGEPAGIEYVWPVN
jgi:hypothetical protein